ncbi:MAG TPA: LON peptidase substrate-binding domain-containing protein, partial [Fluviicola sp.]|nr:LON peptidase substrate-binding domain-containing protein [Fluviicola sp.]
MKDSFDNNTIIIAAGEQDAEFLPLLSQDDEDNMNKEVFSDDLPILPLRNNVLFPGVMIPITIGRDKSLKLLQEANNGSKIIGVVAQKNQEDESPEFNDLHAVGTVAQIIRLLKMPDGTTTVIIQGKRRFEITEPYQTEPFMRAKVRFLTEILPDKNDKEMELLFRNVKELALQIIKNSPNIPSEAAFAIGNIESPTFMVNFISSNMNAD